MVLTCTCKHSLQGKGKFTDNMDGELTDSTGMEPQGA